MGGRRLSIPSMLLRPFEALRSPQPLAPGSLRLEELSNEIDPEPVEWINPLDSIEKFKTVNACGGNVDQQQDGQNLLDDPILPDSSVLPDEVGELAIDVYEDDDNLVIKAPMAGVKADNLELSITDDVISIKGKRHAEHKEKGAHHFIEECYWGAFERTYTLPVPVESEKAKATLKDGLLTILIPKKEQKNKTQTIEVKSE